MGKLGNLNWGELVPKGIRFVGAGLAAKNIFSSQGDMGNAAFWGGVAAFGPMAARGIMKRGPGMIKSNLRQNINVMRGLRSKGRYVGRQSQKIGGFPGGSTGLSGA